jgi:hypothetical protein
MRPERDDTKTRGLRGWWKGDVHRAVEVLFGEHLPEPACREEAPLGWGSKFGVAQGTVHTYRLERS